MHISSDYQIKLYDKPSRCIPKNRWAFWAPWLPLGTASPEHRQRQPSERRCKRSRKPYIWPCHERSSRPLRTDQVHSHRGGSPWHWPARRKARISEVCHRSPVRATPCQVTVSKRRYRVGTWYALAWHTNTRQLTAGRGHPGRHQTALTAAPSLAGPPPTPYTKHHRPTGSRPPDPGAGQKGNRCNSGAGPPL
jgi:hypothetical protein